MDRRTALLYQGYWAAFQAKRQGNVEKADEIGGVGRRRSDEVLSSAPPQVGPQVDQGMLKKAATNEVGRAGTKGKSTRMWGMTT
jgi:hypothetical protein